MNEQKRYWREVREGADRARKEEGPDFKADHITSLGANTHTHRPIKVTAYPLPSRHTHAETQISS